MKRKAKYPEGLHGIINEPLLKNTGAMVLKEDRSGIWLNVQLLEDGGRWHKGDKVTVEPLNFNPKCKRCGKALKRGSGVIYCVTCRKLETDTKQRKAKAA